VSQRVLELKRPMPFEYTFQNKVTYCKFQKFYKHLKEYKDHSETGSNEKFKKVQILVVEANLTNEA
jgi:hypothetical protein